MNRDDLAPEDWSKLLDKAISILENENADLANRLAHSEFISSELNGVVDTQKKEIATWRKVALEYDEKIAGLKARIMQRDQTINNLRWELVGLRKELAGLRK